MATQGRDAAIVGVYEYPSRDVEGKFNPLQIKAASAAKALADAGLTWSDVDAMILISMVTSTFTPAFMGQATNPKNEASKPTLLPLFMMQKMEAVMSS